MEEESKYKSLQISQRSLNSAVFDLRLNRPAHGNALLRDFFTEFPLALSSLDQNPLVRVIILSGSGKHFCSGIDISTLGSITDLMISSDCGRTAERVRRNILLFQDAITAIERCRKPVIAAVHGACIGAGIDIITACDIRFCTDDTLFSVKEVDLAITADLGTLQRLPGIVGYGNAMELALTGRGFSGSEAKQLGLVSRVFASKTSMDEAVTAIADDIAAKSPLAVTGTKTVLLKSRDLNLDQGLDYVATWNSAAVLSDDLKESMSAWSQKRRPSFAKL